MALKGLLSFSFTQVLGPTQNVGMREGSEKRMIEESKEKASSIVSICKDQDFPSGGFQLPLHYPRYNKADYEKMEEWRLDMLLKEYGLSVKGSLEEKRVFAIGFFLWPNQL